MDTLLPWIVWNKSQMVVSEICESLHVLFSFDLAENFASDAGSNVQVIAEHAEGEMCCYESINSLLFRSLP